MKEERNDLALEIASRMGSMQYPKDFGESLIATAEFYKSMTGEDLGIKSLKETNRRVKNKTKPSLWKRFIKFFNSPNQ